MNGYQSKKPMKTIILLRHADIDTPPEPAPLHWPLNVAGLVRAQTLIHVVGHAGIAAIYVSEALRTQQTVAPLAAKLGLAPRGTPGTPQLVQQVLADERRVILIAGHSNTVPEIIAAFGAPFAEPEISGHDNLFVVTVVEPGKANVVRLKYGNPSA